MTQSESQQFSSLSFEESVGLFQNWGFRVEPGPRPVEVTLILEAPDHRSHYVPPSSMLPGNGRGRPACQADERSGTRGARHAARVKSRWTGQYDSALSRRERLVGTP